MATLLVSGGGFGAALAGGARVAAGARGEDGLAGYLAGPGKARQ